MTQFEGDVVGFGQKHDAGKLDWTLMPWLGLAEVVRVLMFGADKYGRENWKRVPDAGRRYRAATFRHLVAYSDGERNDPESGHEPLGACGVLFVVFVVVGS